MGPHDRDIAYLRELAERLDQTPDTDPDNLSIRFNDLYATLDRFMRVVAETDPNVPAQYQMEAADQGANDNLRIYEILAVYLPQFVGQEEVRALKYLNGIRSRVLHQNEDVTPQAVQVLLELTDQLCINAEQLGGAAPGVAPQHSTTFAPASAAGVEQQVGEPQTALGYSNPAANRINVQALKVPGLSMVDPRMLIGGAVVAVLLAAGLVFLLTRGAATPSTQAQLTKTPVTANVPGLTPTPLVVVPTSSGDIAQATTQPAAPPTDTPAPAPPPPPAAAARWTTTDVLNLRASPSTTADIVRALPAGTIVTTHSDNGDQTVENIEWLHVVDDQNNAGWVAKQYLQAAP